MGGLLLPNLFQGYVYYSIITSLFSLFIVDYTSLFSSFVVDLESERGHNVVNPNINVDKYLEAFIDCAMPFKYHTI